MGRSPYQSGEDETVIRCERAGMRLVFWTSALSIVVLCLLCLRPFRHNATAMMFALFLGLFSPLLLIGAIGALCGMQSEIIADEAGLRWRHGKRWRSTPWEGVRDYYDRRPSTDRAREGGYVETQAGQLRLGTGRWSNEARLRAFISRHATSAKPAAWGGAWGAWGERPLDWPLVFHYDTAINRNASRWLHQWHWIGLTAAVVYFGWCWLTTHTLPGWGWLLTPTGLFFVGKQVLPLLIHSTYRETHRRLKQKVRVDAEGLTFSDGPDSTTAAWDRITGLYQTGSRSIIVTAQGEWSFLATLTDYERLRRVIAVYAVNAESARWRTRRRWKATKERRWMPEMSDPEA